MQTSICGLYLALTEPHRLKPAPLDGSGRHVFCRKDRGWRDYVGRNDERNWAALALALCGFAGGGIGSLAAENRSLVNSLLGTAGFPPVLPEDESRRPGLGLAAVRRRTWSQIAREREFAAEESGGAERWGEVIWSEGEPRSQVADSIYGAYRWTSRIDTRWRSTSGRENL